MALPRKASPALLPLEMPLTVLHRNAIRMCNNTVNGALPAAGSTSYDAHVTRPKAHDITPMDVRMQEEYLNLHSKYLANNALQATLMDTQKEEQH